MAVTWNPSDKDPGMILSNGNLTADGNDGNVCAVRATQSKSNGKWYWECTINGTQVGFCYNGIGTSAENLDQYPGYSVEGYSWGNKFNDSFLYHNGSQGSYGDTLNLGDIVGIALDLDNGKIWFSRNGVWQESGDPANGTNPAFTGISGTFFPMVGLSGWTGTNLTTARFYEGDLSYSPPTGFSPLEGISTTNLFDGKVRIKDVTTNLFDGKVRIKDVTTNLFDGKISLIWASTDLFDGKVRIKDITTNLFDGKVRIKDITTNLFDGKVLLVWSSTNLFDGKIKIKDTTIDLFDGKVHIIKTNVDLFDGKLHIVLSSTDLFDGKITIFIHRKQEILAPMGFTQFHNILTPFGFAEIHSVLLGLGISLEQLYCIPIAQIELHLLINEFSDSINAIQILINDITSGDPLSGRLPLLTSIQSESGLQSLVNELSGILAGAQKLLTALTESVSSHASLINELALKNDIQSLLVLLGSMPDQAATHISPKLGVPLEGAPPSECAMCIYLDSVPINNQITDLSFVMDREVTFDVLSFSSSDVQLYAKLQKIVGNKDSALEIQYKGTSWFFLIEEVSGYELSFNVWGRSIAAAKSDAPFEDSVNFVLEIDTLASIVAEDLVPNLSVTWNVVDWTVMADWSVDGAPVQMLKELADSVGAVVRSYPDGTGFYVDEKYTTRPIDLLYAESVEDYDRDVDLISLDASRDLGTRTNAVTVHGHTPFSKYSIRLEAEGCVDVGNPAVIKIYPALEGAGYKLIASDGVPVYQHSLSEEHVEIVSFEGGKGSVSYPITELKSITWDGVIPAGFEHTPGQNEIILTDDTLAAVGEVVYSTRHDVWHGTHSGEGQLLVVCYLDEGGGIVAKVYFGEGDHEADDIDRPILTSIEAAVAAGQAFLDDTSYNRLIRAITVPCSGVSDGDVVSVLSDLSGVTGNTFVLKHEISARVDNEALKVISNLNVVQFEV